MEYKLPDALNSELVKILLNSREAQLILLGYANGKELVDRIKVTAEFTITTEESEK